MTPNVNPFVIIAVAIGCVVYWCKVGKRGVSTFLLPVLTNFIPKGRVRDLADFVLFILLGCLVTLFVVDPATPRQGFAAGLGWTGLLANVNTERST